MTRLLSTSGLRLRIPGNFGFSSRPNYLFAFDGQAIIKDDIETVPHRKGQQDVGTRKGELLSQEIKNSSKTLIVQIALAQASGRRSPQIQKPAHLYFCQ
jgi:hypothetical protein